MKWRFLPYCVDLARVSRSLVARRVMRKWRVGSGDGFFFLGF